MGGLCCAEGFSQLFSKSERQSQERGPQEARAHGRTAVRARFGCTLELSEAYDVSADIVGVGSFGSIRRAACKRTGAVRALKTLDMRKLPDNSMADLSEELRIHKSCQHPNIVHIFECFEGQGELHIAMEACEGGDFRDFIHREGPLCEWTSGLALRQVLEAVMYLHEVHFVAHRDLKLENLLLKFRHIPLEENIVKITDFGLAGRFTPGESSLSVLCGTPEYLAPEVILAKYDEKCDTWSCGIILHELLTGTLPWDAETPGETMWMARNCHLRLDGLSLSEDVKVLLRSLGRKDPRFRASAREALQFAWFAALPQQVAEVAEAKPAAPPGAAASSQETLSESPGWEDPSSWDKSSSSASTTTEGVNDLEG